MVKGEIWRLNLPYPRGSEPAKKRPVLVIQGDSFNRSNINTVVCVIITSSSIWQTPLQICFLRKPFQNYH